MLSDDDTLVRNKTPPYRRARVNTLVVEVRLLGTVNILVPPTRLATNCETYGSVFLSNILRTVAVSRHLHYGVRNIV